MACSIGSVTWVWRSSAERPNVVVFIKRQLCNDCCGNPDYGYRKPVASHPLGNHFATGVATQ